MKKITIFLLALLMLAGCGKQEVTIPETTAATVETTVPETTVPVTTEPETIPTLPPEPESFP